MSPIDIVPDQIRHWSRAAVSNRGKIDNREFQDLTRSTWQEVDDVMEVEERALPFRDADLPGELDETWAELAGGLDVGVAAAAFALNAAGCPTIESCAGHPLSAKEPAFVIFGAWPDAVPRLVEFARAARVGLGNALGGFAEVFSDEPDGLLRFAGALRSATPDLRQPIAGVEISVNVSKLRMVDTDPASDTVTGSEEDDRDESGDPFSGEGFNRTFVDLSGVSWPDVDSVLELERTRLNNESGKSDGDDGEDDEDDDEEEEWADIAADLECGVAGAVFALNAAGCRTIMSCSGHPASDEQPAYVSFWACGERMPEILAAAREAKVGAGNVDPGAAEVYSFDPVGLFRFAEGLRDHARRLGWDQASPELPRADGQLPLFPEPS